MGRGWPASQWCSRSMQTSSRSTAVRRGWLTGGRKSSRATRSPLALASSKASTYSARLDAWAGMLTFPLAGAAEERREDRLDDVVGVDTPGEVGGALRLRQPVQPPGVAEVELGGGLLVAALEAAQQRPVRGAGRMHGGRGVDVNRIHDD